MPDHRIIRPRPDTCRIQLPLQGRSVLYFAAVDGGKLVPLPDASLVRRPVVLDAIGNQVPATFHPPGTVIRNLEFVFFLEIDPGKNAGRGRDQEEESCGKTNLEFLVHGPVGRHHDVWPQ